MESERLLGKGIESERLLGKGMEREGERDSKRKVDIE